MKTIDVCRGCPGVLLGDCESCESRKGGDDELTEQEREDDYRELCADVERDEGDAEGGAR